MSTRELKANCVEWLESINLHPFDNTVSAVRDVNTRKHNVAVLVTEDIDEVIRLLVREQEFFMWRDNRSRSQKREPRGFVEFIRHGTQHIIAEVHPATGGTFLTLSELSFPKSI